MAETVVIYQDLHLNFHQLQIGYVTIIAVDITYPHTHMDHPHSWANPNLS